MPGRELGFRSCWSTPILSHHGAVVGIFAMHAKEPRKPTDAEMGLVNVATRIAGIAIDASSPKTAFNSWPTMTR